ncbi:FecCD transport family protein [Paenibacillus algorifonticola]|uniref:FecCD transport family protein n=1 Tax=Paenibacillus algorifonticola TaxID=684063 RepID=A0A1I1YY90_9BACL|nr:FecCD transport family protein [Paenibacillus algorifonticola]
MNTEALELFYQLGGTAVGLATASGTTLTEGAEAAENVGEIQAIVDKVPNETYTIIGSISALLFARRMNILALDEHNAKGLGLNVEATRMLVIAVAALLPASAFIGVAVLTIFDTFSRILFAPIELPVGIMMGAIGAPFFVYLLRKKGSQVQKNTTDFNGSNEPFLDFKTISATECSNGAN